MSVQVEKLEKSTAKLTIEVSAEKFEEGLEKSYQKNKSRFNIQGFRKGHAPRKFVEKFYGAEVLYEDAANAIIPEAYQEAYEEASKELEIASRPEIDVTQIEKGKSFIFTATVATKPVVTLGQYKGVEVEKTSVEVTDEDVENEIKKVQEANSRTINVTDRAVETGDTAVIDFEGFVDGVAFDGGKGSDYSLVIGSHSFIDTFEDQIVGHSIGDEFDVNVTFPAEYGVADLAGKPAVFKVAVKAIKTKELPEVDDEFVSEVADDCETVEAYKESLKKQLAEKKEKEAKQAKEDAAVNKVVESSTVEISDLHIRDMVKNMIDEMAQNLQQQGISMDMYLQYTGMTNEQLEQQMAPRAEDRIKSREVLEAVAVAENITVSDEELDAKFAEIGSRYNMEVEKVKSALGEAGAKSVAEDVKVSKAVELIADSAVEK
ncbi:MAG: trigger factor [Lachnospiraceae bacterium]|nr:trigger factor [Lachnospiraceae bacterium]